MHSLFLECTEKAVDVMSFETAMRVNRDFRAAYYRLFKVEILSAFPSVDELLNCAGTSLAEDVVLKIRNTEKKEGITAAMDIFWRLVCYKPSVVEKMYVFAVNAKPALHAVVYREIPLTSMGYYLKFFHSRKEHPEVMFADHQVVLDPLTRCINIMALMKHLDRNLWSGHEKVAEKIGELIAVEGMSDRIKTEAQLDRATCLLLRTLPHMNDVQGCWYYEFCNACLKDSSNASIPYYIDKNYRIQLEQYNLGKRMSERDRSGREEVGEVFGMPETVSDSRSFAWRDQEEYKCYRTIAEEKIPEPELLELRPYQQELSEVANRGVNTIICAPTGSGKTLVAVNIMINHFKQRRMAGMPARVAFMVPTVPLVEQQTTALNRYMRKTFWLEGMSGSEAVPPGGRAPYALASHICVFTPQIFLNLLNNIRKCDRLYFTDFTLLIFDECHHCDAEHPYNVLMRAVRELDSGAPQIVGLTASLPTGSGRVNVEAAMDHMMELCASMSAHYITTVRRHRQSLLQHIVPPLDQIRSVSRPKYDPFTLAMQSVMTRIELKMKEPLKAFANDQGGESNQFEMQFPSEKHTVRYETFLGHLKSRLNRFSDEKRKYELLKYVDHLGYYYRAVTINDLLPEEYAFNYLARKIRAESTDNRDVSYQRDLCQIFHKYIDDEFSSKLDSRGEKKEILKVLHEIIVQQYEENHDSRTLIFVTTRVLAENLCAHLNRIRILGSDNVVGYITSTNQAAMLYGQSGEEQRRMISQFNEGRLKVLVATSVAEEGLDISGCNLIIKYNNTGSGTSLIQRRGRARARDSKSILLALDGAIEQRELENVQREALMRKCIMEIQSIPPDRMRQKIEEKIKFLRARREIALNEKNAKEASLSHNSYDISCRACGAFVTKSSDLRLMCNGQYVCCDPKIWERVNPVVRSDAKSISIATLVGKPICRGKDEFECGETLGTIVKLYGAYLPTLLARSVVVDDGCERSSVKAEKWEALMRDLFVVKAITERDLGLMMTSLYQHSPKVFLEMEIEAEKANKQALEWAKKEKKQRVFLPDE